MDTKNLRREIFAKRARLTFLHFIAHDTANPLVSPGKGDYTPARDPRGEVPEWSNGAASKTVEGASLPRVRIPVSPPDTLIYGIYFSSLAGSPQSY